MADAKSNYLERKLLDHALGNTTYTKPTAVYVSLHSSNPGEDTPASELSGGSYARLVGSFSAAATDVDGSTKSANTSSLEWTDLPPATITHIGIFDANTSGNLLYYGAMSSSKTVGAGDNFTINSGSLTIQEQ